jgi:hypothetical protein
MNQDMRRQIVCGWAFGVLATAALLSANPILAAGAVAAALAGLASQRLAERRHEGGETT